MDSFLKAAAKNCHHMLKALPHSSIKFKKLKFKGNVLIAALNVESLYPNIDLEEGAISCKYYLNQRNNQRIATEVLKHLILLILRMNTTMFCGGYFHQIKGTAIGTPMAGNCANCFTGYFETNLLQGYKKKITKEPTLWLRFIDDAFIVWTGSEAECNHFISFAMTMLAVKVTNQKPDLLHLNHQKLLLF